MIWMLGFLLCAHAGSLVEFRQGEAKVYDGVPLAWSALEPMAGAWDFAVTDAALAQADQPVAATIFPGPFRGGAPPDAKDSFRPVLGPRAAAYVRQVVERYGDRVQVWRIGERWTLTGPDPSAPARMGPGGLSADALGEFISAVTAEIKAQDADAVVVGPHLAGAVQSKISAQIGEAGPEYWSETGDAGQMVRSRVSAWSVDNSPIFWDIGDDEQGRTTRAAVGLLQTHLRSAVSISRIPNLAYEQYGYRFTRADGATRWIYWGQGEVMLSEPWPKASTSVTPGADGRYAWRGVGDRITLTPVPALLRN